MSVNSIILNTFLMAASNATGDANFSIVELDRSIECFHHHAIKIKIKNHSVDKVKKL